MQKRFSVAIIGAGVSGLAAANVLQNAGIAVTIYEKSRGVGGRSATRKRDGFTYDHGAQYFKQANEQTIGLITEHYRTSDLFQIEKPIWTFDAQNAIHEGDPKHNAEPRWCYRDGLTSLSKRMAQGLHIHFETRISALVEQSEGGWQLFDQHNELIDGFDRVLITVPLTQAIELIEVSEIETELRTAIIAQARKVEYNPLISVMLGYYPRPRTRPYYALVNTDKGHPISWLAWEHEKDAKRVPVDAGLLIAQMAPDYSREHWLTDDDTLVHDVANRVSLLIDEQLPPPYFVDVQRWRYALPAKKADGDALNTLTLPRGLAFSGDAFVGGRMQLALDYGVSVAQQMK
jgi:renalase